MTQLTIAIPTYNAGNQLHKLLTKIETMPPTEKKILAIDSSSTDQTQTILKKHNVSYQIIPKKKFSHSQTRNLLIRQIKTPFVYFCTQDIFPHNHNLFIHYLESAHHNPEAVAFFGPQIAHSQTPLFFKIETELFFQKLNKIANNQPLIQTLKNMPPQNPFLWFFISNNNAFYKTEFLLKHPFPKVDYGEDLALGKNIILKGYVKIYLPKATIYHSHQYSLKEYYLRQKQDFYIYHKIKTYRKPIVIDKLKSIIQYKASISQKIIALIFVIETYTIKFYLLVLFKFRKTTCVS